MGYWWEDANGYHFDVGLITFTTRDVTKYGYQWSSANVGVHHINFAWGHGGNLIVLLEELNMIVVTTANDLHGSGTPASGSRDTLRVHFTAAVDGSTGCWRMLLVVCWARRVVVEAGNALA